MWIISQHFRQTDGGIAGSDDWVILLIHGDYGSGLSIFSGVIRNRLRLPDNYFFAGGISKCSGIRLAGRSNKAVDLFGGVGPVYKPVGRYPFRVMSSLGVVLRCAGDITRFDRWSQLLDHFGQYQVGSFDQFKGVVVWSARHLALDNNITGIGLIGKEKEVGGPPVDQEE